MSRPAFFKNRFQELVFVGLILLSVIAFYIETDIYAPCFPDMMNYFSTNEEMIQLLLSMNFLGLCLSCPFFGPASDAFGRKPMLCSGLVIFMLGSIGCSISSSLVWMVLFRFLQGIGCGAITSAGLTLFFDVYSPEKSARLVAICNGTVGGMAALAPMIGNWIGIHLGWRANFYLIAILATISCFSIWLFIKETLPIEKRAKISLTNIGKNYATILMNFPFMAHTLIWCIGFSMIIVFIANLSLIFIDYLHVSKDLFGYYQSAIMATYFIGSFSGSYIIKKCGMIHTKTFGSWTYLTGVSILILLTFFAITSPILLIISMSIASLGSALAMTIYFSYSMTYLSDELKGAAMSLTQSLRLLLSSGLVAMTANFFDGTTKPISIVALVCSIVCILIHIILFRKNQHLGKLEASF